MKILVFDIGGTSIKHSVCTENELGEVRETPTNAKLGGRHIMNTIIDLIKKESGYDAIGISTAGQVTPGKGPSFMPTATSLIIPEYRYAASLRLFFMCLSLLKMMSIPPLWEKLFTAPEKIMMIFSALPMAPALAAPLSAIRKFTMAPAFLRGSLGAS